MRSGAADDTILSWTCIVGVPAYGPRCQSIISHALIIAEACHVRSSGLSHKSRESSAGRHSGTLCNKRVCHVFSETATSLLCLLCTFCALGGGSGRACFRLRPAGRHMLQKPTDGEKGWNGEARMLPRRRQLRAGLGSLHVGIGEVGSDDEHGWGEGERVCGSVVMVGLIGRISWILARVSSVAV